MTARNAILVLGTLLLVHQALGFFERPEDETKAIVPEKCSSWIDAEYKCNGCNFARCVEGVYMQMNCPASTFCVADGRCNGMGACPGESATIRNAAYAMQQARSASKAGYGSVAAALHAAAQKLGLESEPAVFTDDRSAWQKTKDRLWSGGEAVAAGAAMTHEQQGLLDRLRASFGGQKEAMTPEQHSLLERLKASFQRQGAGVTSPTSEHEGLLDWLKSSIPGRGQSYSDLVKETYSPSERSYVDRMRESVGFEPHHESFGDYLIRTVRLSPEQAHYLGLTHEERSLFGRIRDKLWFASSEPSYQDQLKDYFTPEERSFLDRLRIRFGFQPSHPASVTEQIKRKIGLTATQSALLSQLLSSGGLTKEHHSYIDYLRQTLGSQTSHEAGERSLMDRIKESVGLQSEPQPSDTSYFGALKERVTGSEEPQKITNIRQLFHSSSKVIKGTVAGGFMIATAVLYAIFGF